MSLEVNRAGLSTTIQDSGRPHSRRWGVPVSGAADTLSHHIANILVGNPQDEAALEITLLGPQLHLLDDAIIAICGADIPVTIDGMPAPLWRPLGLRAGRTLNMGTITDGCRCYLAVRGGFDFPVILGSRSASTSASPGRGRIESRDILPVVPSDATAIAMTDRGAYSSVSWSAGEDVYNAMRNRGPIAILPGPEFELLTDGSRKALLSEAFTFHFDSNRMAAVLTGCALSLQPHEPLLSEGVAVGTIQLPPSGDPIILMPDCQTIGGYPRIAGVATAEIARLAQMRPGEQVRFRLTTEAEAVEMLREREMALGRVREGIAIQMISTKPFQ